MKNINSYIFLGTINSVEFDDKSIKIASKDVNGITIRVTYWSTELLMPMFQVSSFIDVYLALKSAQNLSVHANITKKIITKPNGTSSIYYDGQSLDYVQ